MLTPTLNWDSAVALLLLCILLPMCVVGLKIFFVILREGKQRHNEIVRLQGGFRGITLGLSPTKNGGIRDPRVAKGFVVDTKTGRIVAQGKTSDEYMATLLGK